MTNQSTYKKKKKRSNIEIFSTNLNEVFYKHWLYYSIFDTTPNLSFFESKIKEEYKLTKTFLHKKKSDSEQIKRFKDIITEILTLKDKGVGQWEQIKNLLPPDEIRALNLDDEMRKIRDEPQIPYEQFDVLFDKKLKETITNYNINNFVDTIAEEVDEIDHMSKIEDLNKKFQTLIYGYLNEMNQMVNKNNNLVITKDNVKKTIKDRIEKRKSEHYKHIDIKSNFRTLDDVVFKNGGFQTSRVYLVSGKTGLGKSIFCVNLQKNFIEQGRTVHMFTLENTREEMEDRLYSNITQIPIHELYKKPNLDKVTNEVTKFFEDSGGNFYIEQIPTDVLTKEMIDTIITLKVNKGLKKPDVIIVDYLDLMHFGRQEEERIRLTNLTKQLKQLAQEQNQVVISPTQLNRESYKTEDINVSHLSESSGKQYNSDGVFILNGTNEMIANNLVELIVGKLRHGKSFIKMLFELDYDRMTFRDLMMTNQDIDEYEQTKEQLIRRRKDLNQSTTGMDREDFNGDNYKEDKKTEKQSDLDETLNGLFNDWDLK